MQLRQAREMAGLHVAVLASMLKVPVKKLEALEAGRYDQLPDLTFARALAKSVCRQLKVDPVPILAALPQPEETWRDTSDRTLSAPFVPAREMGKPSESADKRHLSKPTVFAALVLVAAAVLWWSLPDRGAPEAGGGVSEQIMPPALAPGEPDQGTDSASSSPATPADGQTVPSGTSPAAQGSPAEASESNSTGPAENSSTTTAQPGTAPATPAAAPASADAATPAVLAPSPGNEILRLTATETTWVEVLGSNGRIVVQRNLQAGESVGLSAAAPLNVVVGRADAAQVLVRGQSFALEPHTRNNVARFEVR